MQHKRDPAPLMANKSPIRQTLKAESNKDLDLKSSTVIE